jgi:putative selenium metabolism protein SsnA
VTSSSVVDDNMQMESWPRVPVCCARHFAAEGHVVLILRGLTPASLAPELGPSTDIAIDGGRIVALGDLPHADVQEVDCRGLIAMPGNVCGHTHLYSALARGMPPPPRQPRDFPEILELIWWRLDRALDDDAVRLSGLIGAMDAARAGTTTLVDHHASPNAIAGSLDVLAGALDEIGVRGVLCYEVTDRNGEEGARAGLRENERFIRENRRPRMRGMVGAHASFTLGDASLRDVSALAGDLQAGIHIHVAEDVCDEEDSLRRCGKRVAYRLDDAGVLRAGSIAAHCVHLDDGEITLVRDRGLWMAHNCRSNLNNSVGRAPVMQFVDRAILGTDGIDADMFAESRTAFFRAREDSLERGADEFTDMLARGSRLAAEQFGLPMGELAVGAAADLMLLDYDPPTPLTSGNLPWHWAFALTPASVRDVMVDGAWVMRDRALVTVDEEKIRADARQAARRLWQRMDTM